MNDEILYVVKNMLLTKMYVWYSLLWYSECKETKFCCRCSNALGTSSGSSSSPMEENDDVKENDPSSSAQSGSSSETVHSSPVTSSLCVDKVITDSAHSGLFLYLDFHGHASKKG